MRAFQNRLHACANGDGPGGSSLIDEEDDCHARQKSVLRMWKTINELFFHMSADVCELNTEVGAHPGEIPPAWQPPCCICSAVASDDGQSPNQTEVWPRLVSWTDGHG